MKKIDWKTLFITVIVCLLPVIIGAFFYQQLPDQMPIHYGVNNEPNQYASKEFALFVIPIMMAIFQCACCIVTGLTKKETGKLPKLMHLLEWLIPVLTVMIYLIMLNGALGNHSFVGESVGMILGILFLVLGNYMPKMAYESSVSFFHPRPKDEKTFRKQTRIMGYSFVILGGSLILICMLFYIIRF